MEREFASGEVLVCSETNGLLFFVVFLIVILLFFLVEGDHLDIIQTLGV